MRYPYIAAWGSLVGNHHFYWVHQRARAEAEGAPHDAVFARQDGRWVTLQQCPARQRRYLVKIAGLFNRHIKE